MATIELSEPVKAYMQAVVRWLFDDNGVDDEESLCDDKDELFDMLDQDGQDTANQLVQDVFGPWL